jgi:hypothetical protein
MPTITATPAVAYAHCRNARCPGYDQQQIEGRRVETAQTFGENGGDGIFMSFVERSMVTYEAVDESGCGEDREVTGDPRPSYQPISGHDPMGLLSTPGFDPAQTAPAPGFAPETDEEMEARLRAQLREEQMLQRLRDETAEKG